MDETSFRVFLKRSGRAPHMVQQVVLLVQRFAVYLQSQHEGKGLDEATPEDLAAYVSSVEEERKSSAKGHLHAIAYYYEFTGNKDLRRAAAELRRSRIEPAAFPLRSFLGVNPAHLEQLAAVGIRNAPQMLQAGRTPGDRQELATRTGVPLETILELVKLSDLARLPGVKGIRARLYLDAGVDTLDKIAAYEPEAFRARIVEFVERTGFVGVATLPAEARSTIKTARSLPRLVEFE